MPITTSSFFSINLEFAASTASNAQLSLQDTAIAGQVYPSGGGRILGPIDFSSILAASTTTVYDGAANFGWATGGFTANTSRIDRIDFGNDTVTASARGGLSGARYGHSSTGNTNYGYATGGQGGASTSVLDRIDYANDSPTASITRGTLAVARGGAGGVSTQNFGWFGGGGIITPATNFSTVDRIDYSNDSAAASSRGSLTIAKWRTGAAGNNNYGWFAGGGGSPTNSNPAIISTVDRIEFNNDTVTPSLRTTLPMPRYGMGASGNSNYGWWGGGGVPGPTVVSLVHRIDYANDSPTTASPRGPLTAARYMIGASGNANYGWFTGGAPNTSIVDRIDFSNDTTTASPRGPLSISRGYTANTSNYVKSEKGVVLAAKIPFTEVFSTNTYTGQATWLEIPGTYGWFGGGFPASSIIDRIDFANDSPTTANPRGPLSQGRTQMGSGSNSNYGWFLGGYVPGAVSTVDRIDFGNDSPTTALARTSLPSVTGQYPAGMPNGNSFLWMTSNNSVVLRLEFANDVAAPVSRGTYTPSQSQAGLSTQFYGWLAGGKPSSSVERIDFSNDSPAAASPRGPLLATRGEAGSSGNQNYGWIIAGYPGTGPLTGISSVERIDYSNDSPTSASPRASIPVSARVLRSSGNANYSWSAGGATPGLISTVYRIDYSNDLTAATTRGPVTTAREMGGAVSNYVKGRSQPAGTTTSTVYTVTAIADISPGTYGWTFGGNSTGSGIDRIDFANDSPTSASPRGQLPIAVSANAGVSNAVYGWSIGGSSGQSLVVNRITFANDLVLATLRGSLLNVGSQDMGAAANQSYGWIGGGSGITSRVERMDFSNDGVTTVSRGPLSSARQSLAAVSTQRYGWWTGGLTSTPANVSTVDRVDFSNDGVTAATRAVLPVTNRDMAATGNANYAWVGGGTPNISTVYRIDYSNDTAAVTTRGPLTKTRSNIKGMGSANYGWIGGDSPDASTVDRIDYANDLATASARGLFSTNRSSFAAVSNYVKGATGLSYIYTTATTTPIVVNGNYGWWAGGYAPAISSTVDRIDFASDTVTAGARGPLTRTRAFHASASNANYGWFAGGFPAPSVLSNMDRIDFANDSPTSAIIRANLSTAWYAMSAVSNNSYGWFGGGVAPAPTSQVDRIDFANDSAVTSTRGPLSAVRYSLAATSNNSYGWYGGGSAPLPALTMLSTVDRIDFSNDNPTAASPRSPLSQARNALAATGNANYGWFVGGYTNSSRSTVDRIDYSNDTATATARTSLSSVVRRWSATGNNSYGWVGGGMDLNNLPTSSVILIDFDNDTASVSTRGPLSSVRSLAAAASNTAKDNRTFSAITGNVGTYGWFAGGSTNPANTNRFSQVYRIDFSNDSPTATSTRGNLTINRSRAGGTNNSNYGWVAGGQSGSGVGTSLVDRIDFANDSPTTASPRGLLSAARYYISGMGNTNYGWIAGGLVGGSSVSSIDKIDYSNDSPAAANRRGILSWVTYSYGATANTNYGWIYGGSGFGLTYIQRIDFSNDEATASIRGAPLVPWQAGSGSGNSNYGWFSGGNQPSTTPSSSVYRLDYSNDSSFSSIRGPLSTSRLNTASAGNRGYGWTVGDITSTAVDRIDYANDSPTTASPRGPLSATRYFMSGSSNYVQSRTELIASSPAVSSIGWIRGGLSIA